MRWRSQSAPGCATGVAAVTPKMRAARQKRSAPGTHRPSLLRRPGGTPPGPDKRCRLQPIVAVGVLVVNGKLETDVLLFDPFDPPLSTEIAGVRTEIANL